MTLSTTRSSASSRSFSRRSVIGTGIAAAAAGQLGAVVATATVAAPAPAARFARQAAASNTASWRTWVLASPDELRPAVPPDPTPAEIAEVLDAQAALTDDDAAIVQRWTLRPAVLPWTELSAVALDEFLGPTQLYRANGILQAAMYDAVIAAYDAQDAFQRPTVAGVDARIVPLDGVVADRPSFPSAEAAVAGAASAVLTAVLPDAAPGRFSAAADDATRALLQAGVAFPSDVEAGLVLGREIGERAVALAVDDRSEGDWDGSGRMTGDGYWEPTPPRFVDLPMEPLAGTWRCWMLESGDEFRPAPPPAFGTPGYESQVAAVREAVTRRSLAQTRAAEFWQSAPATTNWNNIAIGLISRNGLDLPHAARVLALMGIAIADAEVASWDAKYTYWTARPITVAPDLDLLFPSPPFPSFPSAHATVSNAAAVVLAHLFPEDGHDLLALASEAADSRAWAGIHFPIDNDAGQLLGRNVGHRVTAAAREDGAE